MNFVSIQSYWNAKRNEAFIMRRLDGLFCVRNLMIVPLCFSIASCPASPLNAIYKWSPETRGYSHVADDEHLPAGTVLWVKPSNAATLHLAGTHDDPTNTRIAEQGYYPVPGLQVLGVTNALPADATVAHFDAASQRWRIRIGNESGLPSDLPDFVALGGAIFVQTTAPVELQVDSALEIQYCHQDHLGSSAIISDAEGDVIQEFGYYPFGQARIEHRERNVTENYRFTQKETDKESNLQYFEARFLAGRIARFIKYDPIASDVSPERLANPQRVHPYSYVGNNPLTRTDPLGLDWWDNAKAVAAGAKETVVSQVTETYEFVKENPVKTVAGVVTAPFWAGPAILVGVGSGAAGATSDFIAAATGEEFSVSGDFQSYNKEERYKKLGSGIVKGAEVVATVAGARTPKPGAAPKPATPRAPAAPKTPAASKLDQLSPTARKIFQQEYENKSAEDALRIAQEFDDALKAMPELPADPGPRGTTRSPWRPGAGKKTP
jgi:RHS repeat-associated protein